MRMRCEQIREALSARLDGEAAEPDDAAVDAHLDTCPACAAWSQELTVLHRMVRVREAEAVPDLTAAILAAAPGAPARRRAVARTEPVSVARWALFVVALTAARARRARRCSSARARARPSTSPASWVPSTWRWRSGSCSPPGSRPARGGCSRSSRRWRSCSAAPPSLDVVRGTATSLGEVHHLLDLAGVALLWLVAQEARRRCPRRRSRRHRVRARRAPRSAAVSLGPRRRSAAWASPAAAHASLVSVDPPDGARLDESPDVVSPHLQRARLGGPRRRPGARRRGRPGPGGRGPGRRRRRSRSTCRPTCPTAPTSSATGSSPPTATPCGGHPCSASGPDAIDDGALGGVDRRRTTTGCGRWSARSGAAWPTPGCCSPPAGVAFLVLVHRGGAERARPAAGRVGAPRWSARPRSLVALPVQAALGTGQGPGSLFDDGVLAEVAQDGRRARRRAGPRRAWSWPSRWSSDSRRSRSPAPSWRPARSPPTGTRGPARRSPWPRSPTSPTCWSRPPGAAVSCSSCSACAPAGAPRPTTADTVALVGRFSTLATITIVLVGLSGAALGLDRGRLARRPHEHRLRAAAAGEGRRRGRHRRAGRLQPLPAGARPRRGQGHGRPRPAPDDAGRRGRSRWPSSSRSRRVLVVVTPGAHRVGGRAWSRRSSTLGDVGSVQLTVAPAEAGFNQIHLYTFDPDGRPGRHRRDRHPRAHPARRPSSAPSTREATRAGPAHFQLNGNDLAVGGTWTIEVQPASTASPRRPAPSRCPMAG